MWTEAALERGPGEGVLERSQRDGGSWNMQNEQEKVSCRGHRFRVAGVTRVGQFLRGSELSIGHVVGWLRVQSKESQ